MYVLNAIFYHYPGREIDAHNANAKLVLTHNPDLIRPMRWGPDHNRSIKQATNDDS